MNTVLIIRYLRLTTPSSSNREVHWTPEEQMEKTSNDAVLHILRLKIALKEWYETNLTTATLGRWQSTHQSFPLPMIFDFIFPMVTVIIFAINFN